MPWYRFDCAGAEPYPRLIGRTPWYTNKLGRGTVLWFHVCRLMLPHSAWDLTRVEEAEVITQVQLLQRGTLVEDLDDFLPFVDLDLVR